MPGWPSQDLTKSQGWHWTRGGPGNRPQAPNILGDPACSALPTDGRRTHQPRHTYTFLRLLARARDRQKAPWWWAAGAQQAMVRARAHVPQEIQQALAMARMTALRKPDGGVRGIATGDAFRRLVARTLAKQWADVFDNAMRPYQFAFQARAGTDALAAHVRVAIAQRRDAVLVSLTPQLRLHVAVSLPVQTARRCPGALLPFVRMFYGQPSVYSWWDDRGRLREIQRAGRRFCPRAVCIGAAPVVIAVEVARPWSAEARWPPTSSTRVPHFMPARTPPPGLAAVRRLRL